MSLRTTGYMRGGYGGGSSSGGNGDLYDLLASIFNKDEMSGGITKDPTTGEVGFTPYQASGNWLAARQRAKAQEMNNNLGSQLMQQQHLMQLQKLIDSGAISLENVRGANQVNAIDTTGKNQRQNIKTTGKQNRKQIRTTGKENRDLSAQESTQRITEGKAPTAANIALATTPVPQGGMAFQDPRFSKTGQPVMMQGQGLEQTVENVPTFYDSTGEPRGFEPKVTQRSTPGSYRAPVDPALLQQVPQVQPPPPASDPQADGLQRMQQLLQIQEMLQQYFNNQQQQQGISTTPPPRNLNEMFFQKFRNSTYK
jgi:hypothetical protein